MNMRPHASHSLRQRGFTLTEVALVLGVIAIILGGVWTVAGNMRANRAVTDTVTDLDIILRNYKKLYSLHGIDVGASPTDGTYFDVTCQGVTDGYFPASMLSVPCVTGVNSTYPRLPFGSTSWIFIWVNEKAQGIYLVTNGLTAGQCVQLALQTGARPGLMMEDIENTIRNLPPYGADVPFTVSEAETLCAKPGTGNGVELGYPVR